MASTEQGTSKSKFKNSVITELHSFLLLPVNEI